MSTELKVYTSASDELAFAEKMGHYVMKSAMFGCTRPEQGPIIAYTCRVKGMDFIQFNETYDIMHDGKVRRKANNALAKFRERGGKHKWLNMGDDGKEARIELVDWDGNKQSFTYTMEEARKAQLIKKDGAWDKTPGHMLRVRCISKAIMAMTPEIYCGGYDDDDSEPMPEMNLSQVAPQPTAEPVEKVITPNFKPSQVTVEPPKDKPTEIVVEAPVEPIKEEQKPKPVPAGELPVETVKKLMEVIGDDFAATALNYMISLKWLQEGQSLSNLTKSRADMILAGPERFKSAAAKAVK